MTGKFAFSTFKWNFFVHTYKKEKVGVSNMSKEDNVRKIAAGVQKHSDRYGFPTKPKRKSKEKDR